MYPQNTLCIPRNTNIKYSLCIWNNSENKNCRINHVPLKLFYMTYLVGMWWNELLWWGNSYQSQLLQLPIDDIHSSIMAVLKLALTSLNHHCIEPCNQKITMWWSFSTLILSWALNDLSVHRGDNKPSIEAIAVLVTLHKSLFVKVKENL